jgi:hypothetical protein
VPAEQGTCVSPALAGMSKPRNPWQKISTALVLPTDSLATMGMGYGQHASVSALLHTSSTGAGGLYDQPWCSAAS